MKVLSLFDGKYEVDTDGNVWSNARRNKIKLTGKIHNGYRTVLLTVNNKRIYKLVHRLIAESFIPNPNNKPEVNHKNGNRNDNRACNLEWVTTRENLIHCRDNLNPKCNKINMEIANKIRSDKYLTIKDLCIKYKLKKTEVGYILQNKRWSI